MEARPSSSSQQSLKRQKYLFPKSHENKHFQKSHLLFFDAFFGFLGAFSVFFFLSFGGGAGDVDTGRVAVGRLTLRDRVTVLW